MDDSSKPVPETEFPTFGRLLGIDFGTKRVGIAVSTPEQNISSPVETYTRRNEKLDEKYFLEKVQEFRVAGLIVGLPVHMSGEESQKSKEAREFGGWLGETTGLPVRYWDERFSSSAAEEILQSMNLTKKKRKARIDQLAAQIFLQSYLDSPDKQQTPIAYL
jgi:putative Holliday junction resolvase